MGALYTRSMDLLYGLCVVICVVSVVVMTGLIFAGVIMRVGFTMGARFAEPLSIFFAVQLTMYGAAVCYRAQVHLRLQVFMRMLSAREQHAGEILVHLLMGGVALLMIVYGISLARTTWFQAYPEFDYVKVGLVYSAIPGSGLVTLLFVIEALWLRRTEEEPDDALRRAIEQAEEEEQRLAAGDHDRDPDRDRG